LIRHIVMFSVADDARDELAGLIEDLGALRVKIDVIEALAVGRPLNATEFDCALTVDVTDEDTLQAYREHPAHQPVLERLRSAATQIVVADIVV
jgi:Stress responsive A/B Barrel Domain